MATDEKMQKRHPITLASSLFLKSTIVLEALKTVDIIQRHHSNPLEILEQSEDELLVLVADWPPKAEKLRRLNTDLSSLH